jgi:hypothetical protein
MRSVGSISSIKRLNQIVSFIAWVCLIVSALHVKKVTTTCFFADQLIVSLPREKTYPDIDLRVLELSLQLVSVYPINCSAVLEKNKP